MNEATVDFALRARTLGREHGLFAGDGPLHFGRGPGRLDVMGGIADYSGSLVLQMPLACAAQAAAATRPDDRVRVVSVSTGDATPRSAEFARADLLAAAKAGYAACRPLFAATPWAGYVIGALPVLARERGADIPHGLDLLLTSDVPEAKGLSSSAAIEVAAMRAIAGALAITLAPRELALLCQRVENDVVGAACGVMDQMASACGEPGKLLRLLCQPAEIEANIDIPPGFKFLAVDSGVRHAVSGSDYTSVRIGAGMGFRILAEIDGVRCERAGDRVVFEHPAWGRYLANVAPSQWATRLARVPETMHGGEFLRAYGGISDTVTKVDSGRTYAVRQPTAHPILEHHRVRTFAALLPHASEPGVAELLGELMYQSHASYTACGLGCAATDAIVGRARALGPAAGVYGAKITGGGSGGTVAVFMTDGNELVI